ncbi:MAG: DegT/DnrJ/EryC1/StrS family aminotransferase [Promethearchaeota archaeon]
MVVKETKKRIQVGEFRSSEQIRKNILKILDSGKISEGPYVNNFEKKWAEFIGAKYSVAVNSGTSALIAGLESIKNKYPEKKNLKIITSPLTYIATINAIVITGFTPEFVDVEYANFSISPDNIKNKLENSKNPEEFALILPVHLFGYPVEMDKVLKIAKEYNLLVIEDAAQAHGTVYKNQKIGTYSLLSTFSFYIAHNIQAGQLGAVVTNDKEIANLIMQIKSNGRICVCEVCTRSLGKCPYSKAKHDPRFTHDKVGYNFRTMEFQAAIALAQLEEVDTIIKKRKENVKILNEFLSEFSDIFQLPMYSDDVSYLAYPLIIKDKELSREILTKKLEDEGIETRPIFSFIPNQLAYTYLKSDYNGKLPIAEHLNKYGFYIGCHQYLHSSDLEYIYNKFKKVINCLKI